MGDPAEKLDVRQARQQMYRDLILEAAEREFAERGFEQTKVQDIAETADLSLTTLYNTFSGKDEIYEAIHLKRISDLVAQAQAVVNPERSAVDNLVEGTGVLVRYFAAHPNYLNMHLRDGSSWATESGIEPGLAMSYWRDGIRMLEDAIAEGIKQGALMDMDPGLQARLLVAAMQVWLAHWVEHGMARSAGELSEELSTYLTRMLWTPQPA